MGNSFSNILEITSQQQPQLKLDNLTKDALIDYIQSIRTKKLTINKNFANRLRHIELDSMKLIPMCLELYQKIEKQLPDFVTAHKKFKSEKIEFNPLTVLDVAPRFVNSESNYKILRELYKTPDTLTPFVMEQIGLEALNNTFKMLTTSSDMLGLSKKIIYYLSDYIKLRCINSFNEGFNNPNTIEFNFGRATYVYKKGDKTSIANYRRIMTIPVIINLFHRERMQQCDKFLRDNNLIDTTIQKAGVMGQKAPILQQIVKIKEIIKHVNENNNKAAIMFLDIKDAFGSLDREALFIVLEKYRFDPKFIEYLRQYYNNFNYCTTINDTRINNVSWSNGLIQGCSLSPLLFVTALNYVLSHFHTTYTDTVGYDYKGIKVSMCAYMDDIVLICKDVDSLVFSYGKIVELLGLLGMKLNTQKTNIILPGFSEEEKKGVNIEGITVVDKFTYLGCTIKSDASLEEAFSEHYNKIHEWLMNLDVKKPTNEQRLAEFTEYVQPEIRRRALKLYDMPISNKVKLVTLIKTYLEKWGYTEELQIFPSLTTSLSSSKTSDTILKNIDLATYDSVNASITPNNELFDISPYQYNGSVNFKYGEVEDVEPVA